MERSSSSAPPENLKSDGPNRERAGFHLNLAEPAEVETGTFEPLPHQPEVRDSPATSVLAADGQESAVALAGLLAAATPSFLPRIGLDRLGDGVGKPHPSYHALAGSVLRLPIRL